MDQLNDQDFPLLGLDAVDRSHRELLATLGNLSRASDQEFAELYPGLVAAIERDFREEERLMEDIGLPSFKLHLEQHARMLSALHHAAPRVQAGDLATGRATIVLLPQWLLFHVSTMDKDLVDALARQRQTGE